MRQVIGQAVLVKGKGKLAWEANGQTIDILSLKAKAILLCNVNGHDVMLDMQTGELYQS